MFNIIKYEVTEAINYGVVKLPFHFLFDFENSTGALQVCYGQRNCKKKSFCILRHIREASLFNTLAGKVKYRAEIITVHNK